MKVSAKYSALTIDVKESLTTRTSACAASGLPSPPPISFVPEGDAGAAVSVLTAAVSEVTAVSELTAAASVLPDAASELTTVVSVLTAAASELAAGVSDVAAGVSDVAAGVSELTAAAASEGAVLSGCVVTAVVSSIC